MFQTSLIVKNFIRFFTILCTAFTFAITAPAPKAEARCGVACTYSIAENVIAGAIASLISFIQDTVFGFLGDLQTQMQNFLTGTYEDMDTRQAERDQLNAHATQFAANTVVHGLDAHSNNERIGLRQAEQAELQIAQIGEVEGVCVAMSRSQTFAAARIVGDFNAEMLEMAHAELYSNTEGYPNDPLSFAVRENWTMFMDPRAFDGGAAGYSSRGTASLNDDLKHKASYFAGEHDGPAQKKNDHLHKVSGAAGMDPDLINLDMRVEALMNHLSIDFGSPFEAAFLNLIRHMGGGPTSTIPAAALSNPSVSVRKVMSEWRSFGSYINLGLGPFFQALGNRIVSPTTPSMAEPVLDTMMSEYGLSDDPALMARFRGENGYSYASQRDLIGFLPIFNPMELANMSMFGEKNVFNQTLLYQGYTTAFLVDIARQLETTNMLLGAMLLREVNDETRPGLEAAISELTMSIAGAQNPNGGQKPKVHHKPGLDADERDMTHFINAAIIQTERAIQATPVSAPIQ